MKRLLGIIISFSLIMGLMIGFEKTDVEVKADEITFGSTPKDGETIALLSGNVYEFCANYSKGIAIDYYKKYTDTYMPTAVHIEWEDLEGNPIYYLKIGQKNDLSDARVYKTGAIDEYVEDLYAGCDYYYEVEATVSDQVYSTGIIHFKTQDLPRTVLIANVKNTRDIGGCYVNGGRRVKQGAIYRGANLDAISDAGIEKMVDDFGIKTVLDLREPVYAPSTSPLGGNTNLINISGYQYQTGLQREAYWPTIKNELLVFANSNNYPIYMNCNLGRDRTGTLCFLLEALAGMSELDIYRDFELSYFSGNANNGGGFVNPTEYTKTNFDTMYNYIRNYESSSKTLQENASAYMIKCLGLTQAQLTQIKENMLEKKVEEKTTTKANIVKKPAKVVIKSAKNSKKKSIVVTYKKATRAKGYQICWSTSKKFKSIKRTFSKKTTYTIKKLKKGKIYFLKVRAYNLNGTKKVYGTYSSVKKVKIKK